MSVRIADTHGLSAWVHYALASDVISDAIYVMSAWVGATLARSGNSEEDVNNALADIAGVIMEAYAVRNMLACCFPERLRTNDATEIRGLLSPKIQGIVKSVYQTMKLSAVALPKYSEPPV